MFTCAAVPGEQGAYIVTFICYMFLLMYFCR